MLIPMAGFTLKSVSCWECVTNDLGPRKYVYMMYFLGLFISEDIMTSIVKDIILLFEMNDLRIEELKLKSRDLKYNPDYILSLELFIMDNPVGSFDLKYFNDNLDPNLYELGSH